jgi:hypothetical protein
MKRTSKELMEWLGLEVGDVLVCMEFIKAVIEWAERSEE